ncbi:MAG TPA: papain-like cysteine protease family protein [Solirubrobacterales bacterium]|nr:papain-like cysteine protease family protein [Solirubrobacterales bacterium]
MPQVITDTGVLLHVDDGSFGSLLLSGEEWDRLNFTIQRQEQTQWCWAAVSTSIARFYDAGTSWTQCRVAGAELNSSTCCEDGSSSECNQPWYLDRALNRAGALAGMEAPPSTGLGRAPDEIQDGRPVCVRIGWSGGGGHFIVIEGYRYDREQVALEDPWYGSSDLPVNSFRTAYQGTGSWTHTYLTKAPQ